MTNLSNTLKKIPLLLPSQLIEAIELNLKTDHPGKANSEGASDIYKHKNLF